LVTDTFQTDLLVLSGAWNIFDHPLIPSLNKEGTEGWLIRDEGFSPDTKISQEHGAPDLQAYV
jgi:hypothetical protein